MVNPGVSAVRRSRTTWMGWHEIAAVLFLLQGIGAFGVVDRLIYGEWDGKQGDKFSQLLNFLEIILSALLFVRGLRRWRSVRTSASLALFIGFFLLASTFWSIDPPTALRRGILFITMVVGIIGIAENVTPERFIDLLLFVCLACAVSSTVLLVVYPSNALSSLNDGALRGIFSHKNVLGPVMAAGALCCLHKMRAKLTVIYGFLLLYFCVLTVASKSSTSLVTAMAFIAGNLFVVLYRMGAAGRALSVVSIIVMAPLAIIGVLNVDWVVGLLGKDPTLTGRTDLWGYTIGFIGDRPILGWGYDSFWAPANTNPYADSISRVLGWTVPEAHNGLLEMLLEIGAVGTTIYALVFIYNFVLSVVSLNFPARNFAATSLLLYSGILLIGFTEEVLLDPSQILVTLFFGSGFLMEKAWRATSRGAGRPARLHRWPSRRVPGEAGAGS